MLPMLKMNLDKEETYQPLDPGSSSDAISDIKYDLVSDRRPDKKTKQYLLIGLALLLLGINIICVFVYWRQKPISHVAQSNYYNGFALQHRPIHWNTPFGNADKNVSDALWKSLFPTGGGLVKVARTWAVEQELPYSKDPEYAEDNLNGLYEVAVLHQLHCLTVLRSTAYHLREGTYPGKSWPHFLHCLDSIRQTLMCSMDSTLLYSDDGDKFGDGQVHSCGDWDAMMAWTEKHAAIIA